MERGKISALQMGWMMYPVIITTGILFLPSTTFNYAGRDLWLSPIWASITGFLIVLIVNRLNQFYPKETIIQYSSHILGTVLGKVVGVVILLFYLQVASDIIWTYGEFLIGYFLPQTPQIVVLGSMTLVCAFAVRGGLEVVGRLAEMIGPIFILLLIFIVILLLPDAEAKHMFPILGNGILPSIKGAIFTNNFFNQFLILSFFFPFLADRKKGRKWGVISVFAVLLTMVITNLITLFVLGEATDSFGAPVMTAVSYISIADFLSHLESLVMAIWIAGAFTKIIMFYYVLVLGTAQWLNLSDYRPIVFPVGFLLVLWAVWKNPNLPSFIHYAQTVTIILDPIIQTVIPLFLLLVAYLRNGKHQEKGEPEK
ncbi:spore germination protein KB [Peribacillus simplex]|uniref:Spore germination protein KB n=1 Tax=Peribacillus simplex TaxID=1478 RepID=A0A9X8WMV8_9BACI|nr:endospore germination permease [Peribacillus simplex]SIS01936.1 spore germination protein KB [Peribacillus simplex]